MMVRLLAFALFADEALTFGKGISSDEEPDLWQKDLTGQIIRWIELGQPDERRVRQACGRAAHVVVVCYGSAAEVWWNQQRAKLERLSNLTVMRLPASATQEMAKLAARTMTLQCMVQDGQIMWSADDVLVQIAPILWQSAQA